MRLIVGLGNPGAQYSQTRHNAGFLALDELAKKNGLEPEDFKFDKKFLAEVAACGTGKKKMILAKPQTFMNESGKAVGPLLKFYKLKPSALVIIHDDKDIPLGEFRLQPNRGPAGHNGVISVMTKIKTQNFYRLRLGTAVKTKIKNMADFVLSKFTPAELKLFKKAVSAGLEQLEHLPN